MKRGIVLFGEAEKGIPGVPAFMKSTIHLNETFGNPSPESQGIFFAIQCLLSQYPTLYVRVEEEGFSLKDYLKGVKNILNQTDPFHIEAISLPGVGDSQILDWMKPIIKKWNAMLITTERDLYDYLTSFYCIKD